MMKWFTRTLGATIFVAALVPTSVDAQDGRPTPGQVDKRLPTFTTVSSSGATVTSDRLSAAERWLLIYVMPGTVVSDRLLRALEGWSVADGSRVVVIAAGAASVIDATVRPVLANASSAAIYADPDGSAAQALGITWGPALLGVSNGTVDWMVQGVLNDPHMVEPVVKNWLRVP
jgi:hypothetical protein